MLYVLGVLAAFLIIFGILTAQVWVLAVGFASLAAFLIWVSE